MSEGCGEHQFVAHCGHLGHMAQAITLQVAVFASIFGIDAATVMLREIIEGLAKQLLREIEAAGKALPPAPGNESIN